MAYNDMDVIIYKILAYLYECMKNGVAPREEDMCSSAKLLRIPERYWLQIIEEMQAEGLIGKDIIVYRHVHPDAFKDMTGVDFFKPSLKKSNEESWKELNDIAKKVKIGHEYKEQAFLSTSGVEDKNVMRDKQIHMEIKVKKETSAYVTTNKKESEIIFDQPSVIIKEVIVNDDWSVTIKGEMK